jgi:DNA-binding response OmpR family regulator
VALVVSGEPDLVILDLMLPGMDGIEVCRRIQQARSVPILMLTARDTEADLLVGLAVGADDYMTKPFSPRELVARVRAILRRVEHARTTTGTDRAPLNATALTVGDVELNAATRRVRRAGHEVHLTPTEFELLHHLGRQPGVVFSREQLLVDVWGYRDGYGARTVDSHIRALRQKLGAALIRTVHGVGYSVEISADPPGTT